MKSLNPAVSAMRRYIDLIRPWWLSRWIVVRNWITDLYRKVARLWTRSSR